VLKVLEVINLRAVVNDKEVLKGVNLRVKRGSIHVLMGPNGSGKSTLAYVIMGRSTAKVIEGDIRFEGESILGLNTDERALRGLFLAFQEPPQVFGVRLSPFLISILNKKAGVKDLSKVSNPKLLINVREALKNVGLPQDVLSRELNVGFSGGEKKRSELLQALLLDPKVLILDEIDSGLDVDGVKKVAEVIDGFRKLGKGVLIITHSTRLLKHVFPDEVYVMIEGSIVFKGGPDVADDVERYGYTHFIKR